jgi:NifU-like protein involved in Fe-S cluster formation
MMERFLSKRLMLTKSLSCVNIITTPYHNNIIDHFENRRIISSVSLNNYDKKYIGNGVVGGPVRDNIIKTKYSILTNDSIKRSIENYIKKYNKSVLVDVTSIRSSDTSYDGTNQ